jgi:hypothetical protein
VNHQSQQKKRHEYWQGLDKNQKDQIAASILSRPVVQYHKAISR